MKISKTKIFFLAIFFFGFFGGADRSQAEQYYIDYESGNDMDTGISIETAWKHSPGDSNATANPASKNLVPGDIVNFRGGVKYRGSITVSQSGSLESPITYQTNSGWGSGKAIITGADAWSPTWHRCANAVDCWNNTNWENIWYTSIPQGMSVWQRIHQDDQMLHITQKAPVADPWIHQHLVEWYHYDAVTTTSVRDDDVFSQTDQSYWDGSWLSVRVEGNNMTIREVTSFDLNTNTVMINALDHAPFSVGVLGVYSIFNHPAHLESAGQIAVRPNENRVYIRPYNDGNPNTWTFEWSKRGWGFMASGKNYIKFKNLHIQALSNDETGGAWNSDAIFMSGNGNVIDSCEVSRLSSAGPTPNNALDSYGGNNVEITNNFIHHCLNYRGVMMINGSNLKLNNNTLDRVSGTNLQFYTGVAGGEITGNVITNNFGVHANAISVYSDCHDVNVLKNKVYNAMRPLTLHGANNLLVANNIFDAGGHGASNEWSGGTTNSFVRFINNTFINPVTESGEADHNNLATNYSLTLAASFAGNYVVQNNIIEGINVPHDNTYNIYMNNYHGTFQAGEAQATKANVLPNQALQNYMISASGEASDAGVDVSGYGIIDDYAGFSRPQGSGWDIGAYEYAESGGDLTPPASPVGLSVR